MIVTLRELLYPLPPLCLWCGTPCARPGCPQCLDELHARPPNRCVRCLRHLPPAAGGRRGGPPGDPRGDPPRSRCPACRVRPPAFTGFTALGLYRGLLRWTILAAKTRGERYLLPPLADMLLARLWADGACFDAVVAVPPDPRRLRQRGFHPAEVLADLLAARARRPLLAGALVRRRWAPPQSSLQGAARRYNLHGVLGVSRRARPRLAGACLLVVDDVVTTGSTLDASARALLAAGAASVWAAALADNAGALAP